MTSIVFPRIFSLSTSKSYQELFFIISLIYFVCLQIYELLVLETKPGNAVSIIECDMQVNKIEKRN